MSIMRMIALAGARQAQRLQPSATTAATTPSGVPTTQTQVLDSAMDKVVAFIPSEVIGIYVSGMGVISPSSYNVKWAIFGVAIILIPIFMALSYLAARKSAVIILPSIRMLGLLFLFALIAFIAWAAAMPATPFLMFSTNATQIGGFAVIVFAAIMYKIADLLDILPKRQ